MYGCRSCHPDLRRSTRGGVIPQRLLDGTFLPILPLTILTLFPLQSVGGYFIRTVNLPRFWYYWAHFIDFQTYAFDLLTYNDFHGLVLACQTLPDNSCFCDYPSSLVAQGQCALAGDDVLQALGIGGVSFGLYATILVIIALVYRVLLYVVLVLRRR